MISTALIPFFKLEKLKIELYKRRERTISDKLSASFEAFFNPETLSQTIQNNLNGKPGFSGASSEMEFMNTQPRTLQFKLLMDRTALGGTSSFTPKSLHDEVEDFIKNAVYINGVIHEPAFLKVIWGNYSLDCRVSNVSVQYTLFDRSGNAIRAELDVSFVEDIKENTKQAELKLSSPDLTHIRTVRKGDTLPMMVKEIYGDQKYYIQVAKYNKINNFRQLQPGTKISFPPLEN
ncbi:MAG: hypothetical protein GKR88_10895 [Flavobacteriaceae bacterium]|nr:MAG: hypothetical protein GKR88_10895 [Flavobacteriaceae bacterium]